MESEAKTVSLSSTGDVPNLVHEYWQNVMIERLHSRSDVHIFFIAYLHIVADRQGIPYRERIHAEFSLGCAAMNFTFASSAFSFVANDPMDT